MQNLSLLPYPRHVVPLSGQYPVQPNRRIVLLGIEPAALLLAAAKRLQTALIRHTDVVWEIGASDAGPTEEIGVILHVVPDAIGNDQGYTLTIDPEQIAVEAETPIGIWYGVCTLIQLIEQHGQMLPCVEIRDWPDYPVRGVMLDISRDKVPTMATLRDLVDMLAGWKINQIQLYTEHTFAYRSYPEVWADASPITGEEILEFDQFCRERHIELVPNQNSFGHMERWLIHDRFASLAETHDLFATPWGTQMQGPFSLCPGDPGSIALMRTLYDELLPHFSSRLFNVGLDESVDVGQGRSRELCATRGSGRVYLDYLLQIYQEVRARGRTMQFWGDIIVQHPELIRELPKDLIALEWGYEADHPFAEHCPHFAASGLQFYVCPGTSSWCSIAGRTENALRNLRNAAENGLKHGATGFLNTDWGDRGHWQMLPISFLGYVAGAAYAWAWEANCDLDMPHATSVHAFRDATGTMGKIAADLGNVYRIPGLAVPNGSQLFWVLQRSLDDAFGVVRPEAESFTQALSMIDRALQSLETVRMDRSDAKLIVREYQHTARLMGHACRRGLLALGEGDDTMRAALDTDLEEIIDEYRQLWLARNRSGGLSDSVARLQRARHDYQA